MELRSIPPNVVSANLLQIIPPLLTLLACGPERLAAVVRPSDELDLLECLGDEDCPEGEVCVFGTCVDVEQLACGETTRALLGVTALEIDFGEVALEQTANREVVLHNAGECLLTVSEVSMADAAEAGFTCSPCQPAAYPVRLVPGQSLPIVLQYRPLRPEAAQGELLVRSDDPTAGEDGLVRVGLQARYGGVPALLLEPSELNFGYIPFVPTGTTAPATRTIRVSNRGTGNAVLVVEFVYVVPGTDFSLPTTWSSVSPASPILLAPYDAADPKTWLDLPVTFAPTRFAYQETVLNVHAKAGGTATAAQAEARLVGSSEGPPVLVVSPAALDFRAPSGAALSVGMVAYRQIGVSNVGRSELTVDLSFDDPSGDFSLSPPRVVPLAPGAATTIGVLYAPSAAATTRDLAAPEGSVQAVLELSSNDPRRPMAFVHLVGWTHSEGANDTLKVQMTFENDNHSWAANDFRNVDLELESPLGLACRKPSHTYAPAPNGSYVAVDKRDYCREWTDTLREGQASWVATGAFEEPERVVVFGLGDGMAEGGRFTVRVSYSEDCSRVLSGVLADLLGIGADTLVDIISAELGAPLPINPSEIERLIAENCWMHSATVATIRVFVGGEEVAAPQVRLDRKGDYADVVQLVRQDGTFKVVE